MITRFDKILTFSLNMRIPFTLDTHKVIIACCRVPQVVLANQRTVLQSSDVKSLTSLSV